MAAEKAADLVVLAGNRIGLDNAIPMGCQQLLGMASLTVASGHRVPTSFTEDQEAIFRLQ